MKIYKEKMEKRASLLEEMKNVSALAKSEKRELTKEENERFDKIYADAAELLDHANRALKMSEIEAEMNQPTDGPKGTMSAEERKEKTTKAFREYFLLGNNMSAETREFLNREHSELRTTNNGQTVTTTAGGYLIPQGFGGQIIEALKLYSNVRNISTVLSTATGNDLPFPTLDDTGSTGELLAIETEAAKGALAFGQKTLKAFKFSSKMVTIANELVQDSYFDLETYLVKIFAERLGRIENHYMTLGTGTTMPFGVVPASAKGEDATVSALTRDNLIDLLHSVDPAYRLSKNAYFMMNDSVIKALMKLSIGTADDRPLWNPGTASFGMANGTPDTIEGKPYVVNQDMANIGAGAKSVLFGDFSRYYVREVAGFRLLNLKERYAEFDQIALIMFHRLDSQLMTTGAIKHILHANT